MITKKTNVWVRKKTQIYILDFTFITDPVKQCVSTILYVHKIFMKYGNIGSVINATFI